MTNATRTRTLVTTRYIAELPDGTVIDLPYEASEMVDPFLSDDGTVFRYAVSDDSYCEYEWPEGVDFIQSNNRYHNYVEDVEAWLEDVNNDPNLAVFPVGVYEHGGISYSLAGESIHSGDRFDYCVGACIAIPTGPEGYTDPVEAARAILADYTAWANGDVYGVVEMYREGDAWLEGDTCWGFHGWEMVEQICKEGL